MSKGAPEFLRQKWHYGDGGGETKAVEHLKQNFTRVEGIVRPRVGYEPTPTDMDALAYLVLEWDYKYDPKPNPMAEK